MRTAWTLVLLLAIAGVPGVAHSETWQARGELMVDKSVTNCDKELAPPSTFELVASDFSMSNKLGKMFTITVPADGEINHAYQSPSSAHFEISGNVKSRDLRLHNSDTNCWWKLISQ